MPNTEERIQARERVGVDNKDYSNPLVHLREIVVTELSQTTATVLAVRSMMTPRDRLEAAARTEALRLIMKAFHPEVDWGADPNAPAVSFEEVKAQLEAQMIRPEDRVSCAEEGRKIVERRRQQMEEDLWGPQECNCPDCRQLRAVHPTRH